MEKVTDLLALTAVRPEVLSLEPRVQGWRRWGAQAARPRTRRLVPASRLGAEISSEDTQLLRLKGTRGLAFPLDGALSPNPSERHSICIK